MLRVSLLRQIIAGLLFVAAATTAVLGAYISNYLRRGMLDESDRHHATVARAVAGEVGWTVSDHLRAVESLASIVDETHAADERRASVLLRQMKDHYPGFGVVYMADANARSWLADPPTVNGVPTAGASYADRDYFQQVRDTGKSAISRVQIGKGSAVPNVQLAAPYHDDKGNFAGYISASLELSEIQEIADRYARDSGVRVLVLDKTERLLTHRLDEKSVSLRDVSKIALYRPGHGVESREGEDDLGVPSRGAVAVVDLPEVDWSVAVYRPSAEIEGLARRAEQRVVISVALVMVLASAIIAFLSLSVTRPITDLSRAAVDAGHGVYHTPPKPSTFAAREVQDLHAAMAQMIDRVAKYTAELESNVAARTRELGAANLRQLSTLMELEKKERRLQEDLREAQTFQRSTLPVLPKVPGMRFATIYRPTEEVGGDIYDVTELSGRRVRIFIADATGHGIQASLRTMVLRSEYDRLRVEAATPGEALELLNNRLCSKYPTLAMLCTACCLDVRLHGDGAEVSYASAGHPGLVRVNKSGVEEVFSVGPLIGAQPQIEIATTQFHLARGDRLLAISDGLIEQKRGNEMFDAFDELDDRRATPDLQTLLDDTMKALLQFAAPGPLDDDVTVVAVEIG